MTQPESTRKSDLLEGWALLIGAPIVFIGWITAQLYGVFGWVVLGFTIWFGATIALALVNERWHIPSSIGLLVGPVMAIATLLALHGLIHPHFSWTNAWALLCWFGESSSC